MILFEGFNRGKALIRDYVTFVKIFGLNQKLSRSNDIEIHFNGELKKCEHFFFCLEERPSKYKIL